MLVSVSLGWTKKNQTTGAFPQREIPLSLSERRIPLRTSANKRRRVAPAAARA